MYKISIHLVAYNGETYLPYCLQSLEKQTFTDFSVLIIDNYSEDNTASFIESYLKNHLNTEFTKRVKLVKQSKNIGFAGGHNMALHWTESEYVLMLNQDMILDPHYLEELIPIIDTQKEAGAVSGALYKWDFRELQNRETTNHPLTDLGKTDKIDTLGLRILKNHRVLEIDEPAQSDEPFEVFGISGALPLYRRSALEHTKIPKSPDRWEYFDDDFHSYKEDVDLAYRLRLFGYKTYTVPRAKAWHDRSAAAGVSVIKNRKHKSNFINYHSYKNHLFFLVKNVPVSLWLRYGAHIIVYEFLKFSYLIIFEMRTVGSLAEFFKLLPRMLKKRACIQSKTGKVGGKYIQPWTSLSHLLTTTQKI